MSTSDDRKEAASRRTLTREQQIEVATDMKNKGYSNTRIARVLGINESSVRTMVNPAETSEITETNTIWYPGIYSGRSGEYLDKVGDISLVKLTELVQKRAKEDGEWAIENGFVGDNEDAMRAMMAWVSDPVNIQQCVGHIIRNKEEFDRTVDYVCRDLANGSKYAHGTSDD